MFSFHSRSRSLIPVAGIKDMEKSEIRIEHVEHVEELQQHTSHTQQVLLYLLFLADAILQSSLGSQIDALLPTASGCLTMKTSFLRSILQCAYYFGAATGLVWGIAADRIGRRRVALLSMTASLVCCFSVGFATSLGEFVLLRYLAGALGSAVPLAALASLADTTHGTSHGTAIIAKLPLVVVCGQAGPLLSGMIRQFAQDQFEGVFVEYPALAGQVACGSIVLTIAIVESLFLEETLPSRIHRKHSREDYIDCEKAAFLGQSFQNDSQDSLAISIVDALHGNAAASLPSHISISQLLTAPAVLIILASFSALSLHSSTFDTLLPHLGHHATQDIGLGLPCTWVRPVMLIAKIIAASSMLLVPMLVDRIGLVPLYRGISIVFPVLYITLPVVALAANTCEDSALLAGVFSTLATLLKTTFASAAQVLVLLLALAAAPDASSTGALIGVISISELFKALAVGTAGVSYLLSADYSLLVVNGALWTVLAAIALLGAIIALRLRETPRVGTDLPEECFAWQGFFDAAFDDEAGF